MPYRTLLATLASLAFGSEALAQGAQTPVPPPDLGSVGTQSFPGLMNPAISANGLFLASLERQDGALSGPAPGEDEPSNALYGQGETFGTGLAIQELELQLTAAVDPYLKANMILAIPGGEGIEAEEVYLTFTSIPRVLINVGKMREPFGRENLAHTHALLTIDRALISQRVFGAEGQSDMGVNAALLLPLPWYSELILGVDAGKNEVLYDSGLPGGLGSYARWKNQGDLGATGSLELGVSGATGLNAYEGRSLAGGADLTFRASGRAQNQWRRLIWQNELLVMSRENAPDDAQLGGLYSTLELSPSKRVWVGGRFDYVGLFSAEAPTVGATAIAMFTPTEFSAFRLQAQRQFLPDNHTVDSLVAQANFTIGTHPAHNY